MLRASEFLERFLASLRFTVFSTLESLSSSDSRAPHPVRQVRSPEAQGLLTPLSGGGHMGYRRTRPALSGWPPAVPVPCPCGFLCRAGDGGGGAGPGSDSGPARFSAQDRAGPWGR